MRRWFDERTVIKWVAVAAAALILVALGRAVWRYSETALALTDPPSPPDVLEADPGSAFGLAFATVDLRADEGSLPAWQIDGGDHWVVTIPSSEGGAAQGHRVVPAAMADGATVLEVDTVPADPDAGLPDRDAWRAVHAAVRYAERQGATSVTVTAFGDAGVGVAQFLVESPFASLVNGVVLDASPLDLRSSVVAGLEAAGVPGYLRSLAVEVAALRYGVNWAELDLRARLEAAAVPLLVIQGSDDAYALAGVTREFAGRMGAGVDYVEFAGAGYLHAAAVDPAAYDAAVLEFLESLPDPEAQ